MSLNHKPYDNYVLLKCNKCSAVAAFYQDISQDMEVTADYSDYELSSFSAEEFINRSNKVSFVKKRVLNELELMYKNKMMILDFGGGAGVFVKSCHNLGYLNAFLYEPSEVLRGIAINQLKIPRNRVISDLKNCSIKFDAITMFDVIEHLPIIEIRKIFNDILPMMNNSASFIGTTPNINSINILLHGESDPVIAPPNHTIYFSKKVLGNFLNSLDLYKHKSFTFGLSHNSFFRPEKFEQSWIERPSVKQKIFSRLIRTVFKLLGYCFYPTGRGYHLFFWYRKLPKKQS